MDIYYKDTLEEMTNSIEHVKIMARESVNTKERELSDLIEKQVGEMQLFVNTNIHDIIRERKSTLEKYSAQFNQIKQVCCKFFEQYD